MLTHHTVMVSCPWLKHVQFGCHCGWYSSFFFSDITTSCQSLPSIDQCMFSHVTCSRLYARFAIYAYLVHVCIHVYHCSPAKKIGFSLLCFQDMGIVDSIKISISQNARLFKCSFYLLSFEILDNMRMQLQGINTCLDCKKYTEQQR